MIGSYRLGSWIVDNWSRVAPPFAILTLCSLPIFSSADNLLLILLYTLLPVYMIHQYEEHAHGGFVEFFNATEGEGYGVLTKTSAFWINMQPGDQCLAGGQGQPLTSAPAGSLVGYEGSGPVPHPGSAASHGTNVRASSLHIAEATIKRHLANTYEKMGVGSRGEAARMALTEGWITIEQVTMEGEDSRP